MTFIRKSQRHGTRAKDVRPFKSPRIPKSSTEYTEQPEKRQQAMVTLPTEWADELGKLYPGASLARAIRKFIVTHIKPGRPA